MAVPNGRSIWLLHPSRPQSVHPPSEEVVAYGNLGLCVSEDVSGLLAKAPLEPLEPHSSLYSDPLTELLKLTAFYQ